MAESISISDAREDFAELVNRVAYGHERLRLVRRGRDLAAVVPTEDLELLEALDDELDLADGLTQAAVARTMNVGQSVVAEIESAKADIRFSTLDRYAAAVSGRALRLELARC